MTPKGRVSPFGYPRIKACSQLPTAFRSVPRPSSPLDAKASTKCPSKRLIANPSARHRSRRDRFLSEHSLRNKTPPNKTSRQSQHTRITPVQCSLRNSRRTGAKQACNLLHNVKQPTPPASGLNPKATDVNSFPRNQSFRSLLVQLLVEPIGIEPTTSCLQSRRSPN